VPAEAADAFFVELETEAFRGTTNVCDVLRKIAVTAQKI
jgi:hypothetical protein